MMGEEVWVCVLFDLEGWGGGGEGDVKRVWQAGL
jgi:hypothetical protein